MLLTVGIVGSAICALFALGGAKGWHRALQNGSEEDLVQRYRIGFYRSLGLAILVASVAAITGKPTNSNSPTKPQSGSRAAAKPVNSGIS